ncbi:MAG: DUF885 domain-containing protein [Proteobacteria bacterium]|nr:DUF885 domain-containing protein [Pseudomonadota bacterium]
MKFILLVMAAFAACTPVSAAEGTFPAFVDKYLDRFGHFHPSIAAGNGLHAHDGELEDFSAPSITKEVEWLHGARRNLDAFADQDLTADERVDRKILQGIVDGWLLDLDTVRTWSRNPMIYVAAISDGLHDLISMESAPAPVRMDRVRSKLRAIPGLIAAEKANVKAPPRVFVERAIAMLDGVEELLSHDLPLAFPNSTLTEADAARAQIAGFRKYLQATVLPSANGSYVVGTANVEARYRAEELIDLPASQLLAIGQRELASAQKEFTLTAAKVDSARPALDVWRAVQDNHPARGQVVPAARAVVGELFAFIEQHQLMRLPADHEIVVAPAPAYDLGLASMHSSPPLEPNPVRSYYYITDADATWPLDKQNEWLRTFNYATLADISAHEVAPGHFVHSLYMRKTPGKVRRIWVGLNPFPQPSSGQDGWAHYAEQMVSEQGFHANEPRYRLAMLAESLNRLCRLIAGINLHSGKWTVDEATAFFQREAHLPAVAANREAVRGTYDPTYGGYALGKLAAYKLRRDYQKAKGASFNLREFHERVMTDGIAPWWAHRQLLLPGDTGAVLE